MRYHMADPIEMLKTTGLSLTKGRPIAVIYGGEDDKEIVGLVDPNESKDIEGDPIDLLGEDFFRMLRTGAGKKLKLPQLEELIDAVRSGDLPDDEDLHEPFHKALSAFIDKDKSEIKIQDKGTMVACPNFEIEREVFYIAGPSGSGKSTWAALFGLKFRD